MTDQTTKRAPSARISRSPLVTAGALVCTLCAAMLTLGGCSALRLGAGGAFPTTTRATTGTAVSGEASAAATYTPNPDLPKGMGPIYAPTEGTHPQDRILILGSAQRFLKEKKPLLVDQIIIQEPYVLGSVLVKGTGRTWVYAMRHDGDMWTGIWKSPGPEATRTGLETANVISAPDLLGEFDWRSARYGGRVSKAAAEIAIKAALNKAIADPAAQVSRVNVILLVRDADGHWWAGGLVDQQPEGGKVLAAKLPGEPWGIIDFGTGVDARDLQAKAPGAVTRAFLQRFPARSH